MKKFNIAVALVLLAGLAGQAYADILPSGHTMTCSSCSSNPAVPAGCPDPMYLGAIRIKNQGDNYTVDTVPGTNAATDPNTLDITASENVFNGSSTTHLSYHVTVNQDGTGTYSRDFSRPSEEDKDSGTLISCKITQ